MANLIIPIDKCYNVSSTPINKNVIQKVTYTERNIVVKENNEFIEDKTFDYWVFKNESTAEANPNFKLNEAFKFISEETKTSNGSVEFAFSTFPYTRKYNFTRTSKVLKYSIQYSLSDSELGILLDSIVVKENGSSTLYQTIGDLNDKSFTTSYSNLIGLDSKEEFDSFFNNITTYNPNLGCFFADFDFKTRTYTIYIGLEKQVDYSMSLASNSTPQNDMVRHFYGNYVLNVVGDIYVDANEDISFVVPYGVEFKDNDNSYELRQTYLSSNNIVRCLVRENSTAWANLKLGDWGSKKVNEEYSKGKMVVNIEMPLLKLYNNNGDIGVDKEILKIGQTFEFQYLKNRSFNNYSNVLGKTFCIINVEFTYNGIGKMTIVGKEV